ncbi:MAG TPA: tail fiber domain-containing protein [Phycisphaerales bacterium]|nr:tail fiber domain-containing protein [Phycisphaerales bacterium]
MRKLFVSITVLLLSFLVLPAQAQPFTYQGRLSDAAGPVSGTVDLRFRLYRNATGTQQVGTQVLAPATHVDEGTFTTSLDFGAVLSSDEERWLEIDVRYPGENYTTLSPRQRIGAVPVAHKLTGLQFTPSGPAAADQVQDVRSISAFNVLNGPSWQSFTPGVSGTLDRIEVEAVTIESGTLTVTIHAGVGLNGPVLATSSVSLSQDSTATLQFNNATLLAGNAYTMSFSSTFNVFLYTTISPIPGTVAYSYIPTFTAPSQWVFRTYMRPPATISAMAERAASAVEAQSAPWSGLTGQAEVSTPAIGTGWQMFLTNRSTSTWRGGIRLADNGFLEVTNNANATAPNFARLNGTGAWTAVSDRRLKHDIHAAEGNLAAVLKLQPVTFRWNNTDTLDLGLIAQDVRQVLPHLVTGDESKENLTVNYSQLSVVAIGAIQEQQQKIESLEQRLLDQTRRNDDLQSRLETLEQLLGATK